VGKLKYIQWISCLITVFVWVHVMYCTSRYTYTHSRKRVQSWSLIRYRILIFILQLTNYCHDSFFYSLVGREEAGGWERIGNTNVGNWKVPDINQAFKKKLSAQSDTCTVSLFLPKELHCKINMAHESHLVTRRSSFNFTRCLSFVPKWTATK
jgi:hypothetical protein